MDGRVQLRREGCCADPFRQDVTVFEINVIVALGTTLIDVEEKVFVL